MYTMDHRAHTSGWEWAIINLYSESTRLWTFKTSSLHNCIADESFVRKERKRENNSNGLWTEYNEEWISTTRSRRRGGRTSSFLLEESYIYIIC